MPPAVASLQGLPSADTEAAELDAEHVDGSPASVIVVGGACHAKSCSLSGAATFGVATVGRHIDFAMWPVAPGHANL